MRFLNKVKELLQHFEKPIKDAMLNWKDYFRYKRGITKNIPSVFVYQMGKVASSSIYYSLKKCYSGFCVHGHLFAKDHTNYSVRLLYKYCTLHQGKLKIISPIRQPIERNFAEYFSSIEVYTQAKYHPNKYTQKELGKLFLLYYPHFVALDWFDDNIKKHFDIDVFEYSFPDEGHLVISSKKVDILILKYDIEDKRKEKIIGDFVNCPEFKLENRNIGSTKNYAEDYEKFKDTMKLPPFLITMIRESKYYNHFYSKVEITTSMRKYSDDIKVS